MERDQLPFVVSLDDCDEPGDVVDTLVLAPFVAGSQPAARHIQISKARADARLIPVGVQPTRVVKGRRGYSVLAEGDGWTLRGRRWGNGVADIVVVARSEALADEVMALATVDVEEAADESGATVDVAFWHRETNGRAARTTRRVAAPTWTEIRRNYTASVASTLDALGDIDGGTVAGRLLLLHGPPGTGKTTALRSLARTWRSWCRTEVVVDPERLYGDSAYLTAVMLDGDDDDGPSVAWRLLVLEDCDEMIRADAKKDAGQALARLLNMTDGLIGQGLNLFVALTTNERLGELHPAVTRPGRCLAEIFVGPLQRGEAAAWLGTGRDVPPEGLTLAELYARRGDVSKLHAVAEERASALYL